MSRETGKGGRRAWRWREQEAAAGSPSCIPAERLHSCVIRQVTPLCLSCLVCKMGMQNYLIRSIQKPNNAIHDRCLEQWLAHCQVSVRVNSFIVWARIKVNLKFSKIYEGERRRQGGCSRKKAVAQGMAWRPQRTVREKKSLVGVRGGYISCRKWAGN